MRMGVLGSGMVGRAISARLVELKHEVMIGTRDASKLAEWNSQEGTAVRIGSFGETAAHGEMIFNALRGAASLDGLHLAGDSNLAGKVLVDISDPLDFSAGFPPSLTVSNTDSLGEQIQRSFPAVKVVKTLNTINCRVMVHPQSVGGGDHHVFVSGNDETAKSQVTALLQSFGWRQIIDLGDITTCRGVEMYLPLWVRLFGLLGTSLFNIKIVT